MDNILFWLLEPWVKPAISIIVLITVVLLSVVLVYHVVQRVKKGDELSFFGVINLKPNKEITRLENAFESLNQDSKQKAHIIKLLNQITIEVTKAWSFTCHEKFMEHKRLVYSYALHGIGQILTKQKSNIHRVAVFVDAGEGYLKIHEGHGFTPGGLQKLRLPIDNSAAGFVFRTGNRYYSSNITEDNIYKPHPKTTHEYHSLMCVPITFNDEIIGVLSIDGKEKDSFTKDDLDYLTYFANSISTLLYLELKAKGGTDNDKANGAREEIAAGKVL